MLYYTCIIIQLQGVYTATVRVHCCGAERFIVASKARCRPVRVRTLPLLFAPSTFDFDAPQPIKLQTRIRIVFTTTAGRHSFAPVSRAGSPWRRPRSAELPPTRHCKMKPVARRKRRTPQIFPASTSAKCHGCPGRKVGMLPVLTFLPATSQHFNTRSGSSKAQERAPVVVQRRDSEETRALRRGGGP